MNKKDLQINIIGAGISGLIAAKVLEENGYAPTIIEAESRAGGRIKTDLINGYALDHGFQVLLTAYPAVKKHFDMAALDLQIISPGAVVFKQCQIKIIGDPLRDRALLLPTLFSGIGSYLDKLKILKLSRYLKKKNLDSIFIEKETTTMEYLLNYGFSDKIIHDFFKPFFSGIFLEDQLETSSRMFQFIFKMFEEGYAAIPRDGMEAIPKQLVKGLKKTSFKFNTKVTAVKESEIILADQSVYPSDYTIVAGEARHLLVDDKKPIWKSCDTLYFTAKSKIITKKLIGLIPAKDSLINNVFYHTCLPTATHPENDLLSVTVVANHALTEVELCNRVEQELKEHCGIDNVDFLKHYAITKALPKLSNIKYKTDSAASYCNHKVFVAGDQELNSSLNAAILSGERAAQDLLLQLDKV
jgi:protoporphyrinogen oxidase